MQQSAVPSFTLIIIQEKYYISSLKMQENYLLGFIQPYWNSTAQDLYPNLTSSINNIALIGLW